MTASGKKSVMIGMAIPAKWFAMKSLLYSTILIFSSLGLWTACGGGTSDRNSVEGGSRAKVNQEGSESCPAQKDAPALLPGVSPAHRSPEYWYGLLEDKVDLDEVLLSAAEVENLNRSYQVERPGFSPQRDLLVPMEQGFLETEISGRFDWMKAKLDSGEYRRGKSSNAFLRPASPTFTSTHRVALEEIQIYCAPTSEGIFDSDTTSNRTNRNHCSNVHGQELIEILAPWEGDMLLARTATSWGFVKADASLSPAVSGEVLEKFAHGPYAVLSREVVGSAKRSYGRHTKIPYTDAANEAAFVATSKGIESLALQAQDHRPAARPFTRRAVIEEVLSYLGTPYGFGGADGGIDCSRLMLDLMGSFGVELPRFSGWQAKGGSFALDVEGVDDQKKQEIIDHAAESGVVILHIPGHIMMYLGRDDKDTPMAVHALSYYLDPCEEGGSTTMLVGRVQIGDLELGRNTRKTALIERITKIAVIGKIPSVAIQSLAKIRPAAPVSAPSRKECKSLSSQRVFLSPRKPYKGAPLRVVATSRDRFTPSTISIYNEEGELQEASLILTDGPPIGKIAQMTPTSSGKWMAVVGDGESQQACLLFKVASSAPSGGRTARGAAPRGEEEGDERAIWSLRRRWNPAYEDLFATFSERLFDYPAGDDRTWPNFHSVLRDPDRNILYNYLGKDEEEQIRLKPDCADLPYTLRAYFAWKLGLPFGVHECHRAKEGRPPKCKMVDGNLMARSNFKGKGDVAVFVDFVNRHVRRMVHSSSGRTAPDTDLSDFYPVELKRESLRPGTLFTDPYGHLLVVVDWIEQGKEGYGTLVGADAQPDGTIGRRRFWQGSFLFRPDVKSGGAGFKAFRPWYYDKKSKALKTRTNRELRRDKTAIYSKEQYEGSEADFYDRMESIINPRALDPVAKLVSLVDALQEQVTRRGTSVRTGEDFMKSRRFSPIDMPKGSKIFLTSGPWEDFSTPSRDWRLLIAIHTVVDFPDAVRRSPQQYGIEADEVEARAAALQKTLTEELAKRKLVYTRSDGSAWTITLKDLIDRRVEFEMSYNPNDCPEIRWAAPEGSEEMATCKRHAPAGQRKKMRKYRNWFSTRSRPAS